MRTGELFIYTSECEVASVGVSGHPDAVEDDDEAHLLHEHDHSDPHHGHHQPRHRRPASTGRRQRSSQVDDHRGVGEDPEWSW